MKAIDELRKAASRKDWHQVIEMARVMLASEVDDGYWRAAHGITTPKGKYMSNRPILKDNGGSFPPVKIPLATDEYSQSFGRCCWNAALDEAIMLVYAHPALQEKIRSLKMYVPQKVHEEK